MIREDILKILVCPEERRPLAWAESGLVNSLNQRIEKGELKNRAGKPVSSKLTGGLVRAGGDLLYPVIDDIPILLPEEAIPLDGSAH
jgi:uncharacterized protein YbaR (Trm112 family)